MIAAAEATRVDESILLPHHRIMVTSASLDGRSGVFRPAFLAAFFFALLSSISVICERLAQGRSALGWLCSIAVIAGAVVLILSENRPRADRDRRREGRPTAVLSGHLLGSLAAVSLVHLAVLGIFADRLVERPAQLVNDGVLVAATLGFVWSFVSRNRVVRLILPLLSYGLLAGYVATMTSWHLDPFPGLDVQHYVVGQVVSTSAALLIYYFFVPDPTR